jgi:hypothetical protein
VFSLIRELKRIFIFNHINLYIEIIVVFYMDEEEFGCEVNLYARPGLGSTKPRTVYMNYLIFAGDRVSCYGVNPLGRSSNFPEIPNRLVSELDRLLRMIPPGSEIRFKNGDPVKDENQLSSQRSERLFRDSFEYILEKVKKLRPELTIVW